MNVKGVFMEKDNVYLTLMENSIAPEVCKFYFLVKENRGGGDFSSSGNATSLN